MTDDSNVEATGVEREQSQGPSKRYSRNGESRPQEPRETTPPASRNEIGRACTTGPTLTAAALACYDAPDNHANYLKMQAVLANLGLRQRSELGRAFELAMHKRTVSGSGFTFMAMYIDSMPEWSMCSVHVPGASQRSWSDGNRF